MVSHDDILSAPPIKYKLSLLTCNDAKQRGMRNDSILCQLIFHIENN